jgi:ferredoxin
MMTQKILSGETMEKILTKKTFSQWVKKLEAYEVYAPVLKDDICNYEVIQDPDSLNLEHLNTTLAPKRIIFPQKETFLEFNTTAEGTPEIREALPEENPIIILGIKPCDARALSLTDKVFSGDFKDVYYWGRREQAILVGLACNQPPSSNCFCLTVDGSPHSKQGFDILMTDLGDKYFLESLSKSGDKLINLAKDLFRKPTAKDKSTAAETHSESEKKIKRQIQNIQEIPPKLSGMFNSPLWIDEAMSCLRCGICTYLCPTCHCFDISDELTSSSPIKGKRIRTWDTCQFPDFTMHSSGHNPRSHKASRLRQRIMHKFQYFVENYDNYQCTGCGRCISLCPVGIDIIEVLEKVRDYG